MSKNNSGPSYVGKHNKKKSKNINTEIINKFLINPIIVNKTIKIGRNDLCMCGSNKKYKNCCLNKAQII